VGKIYEAGLGSRDTVAETETDTAAMTKASAGVRRCPRSDATSVVVAKI